MNMQRMLQEAQKMQAKLLKEQEELEKTTYEGKSSLVDVIVNGKKDIVSVKFNLDNDFSLDDMSMLEDMVVVAINDAMKKADSDKENRLGKYSQGLSGLM